MAIIHMGGGTVETLKNESPTLDPFGFDDVTTRILFRGDMAGLLAAFPLGGTLSGTQMYCIGPQGASEARFGHIWADIGYKGFYQTTGKPTLTSHSVTTRETELPRNYTKANGSNWVTYVDTPMVPSKYNPKTGTYWRVRLIDRLVGSTVQGVTVGTPSTPPSPPTMNGPKPLGFNGPDWRNLIDPTVNYPFGWVLRDFQTNSQFAVGNVALYFWTARFEYVDQYAP